LKCRRQKTFPEKLLSCDEESFEKAAEEVERQRSAEDSSFEGDEEIASETQEQLRRSRRLMFNT
jgi:hypothetical protein